MSLVLIFLLLLMPHASEGTASGECVMLFCIQHKVKMSQSNIGIESSSNPSQSVKSNRTNNTQQPFSPKCSYPTELKTLTTDYSTQMRTLSAGKELAYL